MKPQFKGDHLIPHGKAVLHALHQLERHLLQLLCNHAISLLMPDPDMRQVFMNACHEAMTKSGFSGTRPEPGIMTSIDRYVAEWGITSQFHTRYKYYGQSFLPIYQLNEIVKLCLDLSTCDNILDMNYVSSGHMRHNFNSDQKLPKCVCAG